LQGFLAVGGGFELEGQVVLLDVVLANLEDTLQGHRVDIDQGDLAAFEYFALEDIAQRPQTEVRAPRADQDNVLLHNIYLLF
jgi:hypothetical protein